MNENEYVRKDIFDERADHLATAINDTNNRIDDIKDSVNWNFAVLTGTFVIVQIGIGFLLYILAR